MEIQVSNPFDVAKRAMFLAYQAIGSTSGSGFLQAKGGASEDDVWENVSFSGDYPGASRNKVSQDTGEVHADYVFGKMMKLSISWDKELVCIPDSQPSHDYQGWVFKYPDYESLIREAVKSFG